MSASQHAPADQLQQSPQGGGDAQSTGQDHYPQRDLSEGALGDLLQEGCSYGLAQERGGNEGESERCMIQVEDPAEVEHGESHEAHDEEVERARTPEVVL